MSRASNKRSEPEAQAQSCAEPVDNSKLAISSDFAILDIKKDRKKLSELLAANCRVHVVLRGVISDQWGEDDGTSIEFMCDVADIGVVFVE